jgi:putative methyltransferase (TIGR04325 family)
MDKFKSFLKNWIPIGISDPIKKFLFGCTKFEGNFSSWQEASSLSSGYDEKAILSKTLASALEVKSGQAAYERDSVIFSEIVYSWPVLAALMHAAAINGGILNVLDFGGALGSSYFQNHKFFQGLIEVRWAVVEQLHYVKAGRGFISDERLSFFENIDDAICHSSPNVILLSSVLQYLSNPEETIKQLSQIGADFVIIDRTPFLHFGLKAKLKIQHVPKSIYSASYPCWFFSFNSIESQLNSYGYKMIERFNSLDDLSQEANWQGMIFKKV